MHPRESAATTELKGLRESYRSYPLAFNIYSSHVTANAFESVSVRNLSYDAAAIPPGFGVSVLDKTSPGGRIYHPTLRRPFDDMGDAGSPILCTGPAGLPSPNPTESFWQTSHPNSTAHHRSTSSLPEKVSVVVIGTGISGTFSTHELVNQSKDCDVLVLEARTTCSAATGRNGGHLEPLIHSERTAIIDFELNNYHHIASLVKDNDIPCDFRPLPSCLGFWNKTFFEDAKAALGESADTTSRHRALVRIVESVEELKMLRLEGAVGALVQDIAASLSPYKLVIWLWEMMLKRFPPEKLNLQTETPVTSISRAGGEWLLRTPRGAVRAQQVILATNGYTSHLLPQFAMLISPIQAQMSALVPPADSPFAKRLIPYNYGFLGVGHQARIMTDYLVQNPILKGRDEIDNRLVGKGGHLMFGGGRAHASGHGIGVSDDDYVDPGAEMYLRTLPERLNLEANSSSFTVTSLPPSAGTVSTSSPKPLDIAASWTGIIGSSIDGHPWVGGVPGAPGLFLCAGYTGHGMTNAGLCGRHAARLVLASLNGQNWEAVQRSEVEKAERGLDRGGVPMEYVLSQKRMDDALRAHR